MNSNTNNSLDNFSGIVDTLLQYYKASLNPSPKLEYLPASISVEPTNRCNLRCLHCYHSDPAHPWRENRGFMDLKIYKKIIDEACHWARHITLDVHGEPLLHKNILDMIAYAKTKGMAVSIITNATLLKKSMADALLDLSLDRIVFSFEGSNKELHQKVRHGSNYDKTLANILYFISQNAQKKADQRTFVCMSMVDSYLTQADVQNYRNYFQKLPVNTIFISRAINFGGTTEFGRKVGYKNNEEAQICCRIPWEELTIAWNGDVLACPVDASGKHTVGNVCSDSLKNIWNGGQMRKFRSCHINNDFQSIEEKYPLCLKCNLRLDDKEYSLAGAENLVKQKIIRNAQIYGKKLGAFEDGSLEQPNEEKKLAFALGELNRIRP